MTQQQPCECNSGHMTAGILLTTIGSVLLLNNLGLLEIGNIWQYWPVILIAIGVAKLLEADRPVKG